MKALLNLAVSASILLPIAASAQNYPARPVRMVAPGAGGSGDFTARFVAQGLTEKLGQPVVVENMSNIVAIESVAKAKPDGYTLLFYGSGLWTLPLLQKTSYDPVKDFVPVAGVASAPSVITVNPALSVNSVKELIATAREKPGQLNYSSGQVGTVGHLAGELFKKMAKVSIVHVPYSGTGNSVTAVLKGEVQLTFAAVDTVTAHLKSGKLRAIAVMNETPSPLAPGLPTVAASGLPDYVVSSNNAVWAPSGTPQPVVTRLSQTIIAFLKQPDSTDRLFKVGLDTVASSPEQVSAKMKSEMVRWGDLIKELGIRQE